MGWKNIKEHYRIGHIVAVRDNGICIGSPYVPELIIVRKNGDVAWGSLGPSKNDDLSRYFAEMTGDQATLLRLFESADTFTASIPVYTYQGGGIIEKRCEAPGWPNITHDGDLMYENSHSTDKEKVVGWAKQNASLGVKWARERIAERERELAESRERLRTEEADLARLEAEYPGVAAAE